MKMSGNTILVTGGSNGIGLALAKRFLAAGNTVVVCGRREEKLHEAREHHPGMRIRVCDVANEKERLALVDWLSKEHPDLNVLVNNAGIQQRINLLTADQPWEYFRREIAINLDAPIHLSLLLARRLVGKPGAAIVNVSSGLAFTPMAAAPVYCATKAAMHSFSQSLRAQLTAAGVRVVEIAPPAVNTDLGGSGLHTHGVPLDEFADAVMASLAEGSQEIGYGTAAQRLRMSRNELDAATAEINLRVPLP